jgi:hypothetical protein
LDLNAIVSELKSERDRIGKAITALLEGAGLAEATKIVAKRGRPKGRSGGISAAGRKRLSEAMKARWAARKMKPAAKAQAPASTASTSKKRRGGMSAAGKRRISEAMKKRWAEKRQAAAKAGA